MSYQSCSWDRRLDRAWLTERWAKWVGELGIQIPITPVSWRVTATGEEYRVSLQGAMHVEAFKKYEEALSGVCGESRVTIAKAKGNQGLGDASVAVVTIVRRNALRCMGSSPLTSPDLTSASAPIHVGMTDKGEPVLIPEGHVLIVGESGSGKSVCMSAIAIHGIKAPDIYTVGIDMKGGREFAFYEAGFDAVAYTPLEAVRLLVEVEKYRAQSVAANRGKNRKVTPGVDQPMIRVMIDDFLPLAVEAPQALGILARLMSQGRSEAIQVVAAIQTFHASLVKDDQVGPMIRANFAHRLAFRTSSPTMTEVALGQGRGKRYPAHEIGDDEKGVFYYATERSGASKCRTFEITDRQLDQAIETAIRAGAAGKERRGWSPATTAETDADRPTKSADFGTSQDPHAAEKRGFDTDRGTAEIVAARLAQRLSKASAAKAFEVWRAMHAGPGPWSANDLRATVGGSKSTVQNRLNDLHGLALIALVEGGGRGQTKRYRLVPVEAPGLPA